MPKFSDSIKEFINVAGLAAKIKALEAELSLLKQLQASLGGKTRGRKPGQAPRSAKGKRGPRGEVKETVLAYLQKNKEGKAGLIAKASGLKIGSINQVLYSLKKAGTVSQAKKRGSPFVWGKK